MVTTLLAGSSLAYVGFIFLPGQNAVAESRAELREQQMFIVQSERLSMQIKEAQEKLNEANQYGVDWRARARTERGISALFGDITKEAAEAKIVLRRFDPQPSEKLNVVFRLPISVAYEGTFHQIYDFVKRIEALPDSIWVTDLQLRKERENSDILHAEMELTVFADNFSNSE